MDINQDFIRRETRAIGAEHRRDLAGDRATLDRMIDGPGLADNRDADAIFGGLHRRRFLLLGGVGVLSSAVFAACSGARSDVKAVPTTGPTTTSTPPASTTDLAILRTASSIEALAVSVYEQLVKGGLIKTASVLSLAKLFMSQHKDHADLFDRTTTGAGGKPFTDPNPVLLQQLVQPRLGGLKTEMDAVTLAYDLEHLASATYQGGVGQFENRKHNATIASVGGSEARHVALLAVISGKSPTGTPNNAFQVTTDAVKPGTGV